MARMYASNRHIHQQYEAELKRLRETLLLMAGYAEQMLDQARRAFIDRDSSLAQQTIALDDRVDTLELEIDELCRLILTRRQPVASDLRMIALAMKTVTDLERIGDLSVNICERSLALTKASAPRIADKLAEDLKRMFEVAQSMIRIAMDAFVNRNLEQARSVCVRDREVDELYRVITDRVQSSMRLAPENIGWGIHINAVAKFVERIADHTTNLAELVIFLVEGRDVRHASIDRD